MCLGRQDLKANDVCYMLVKKKTRSTCVLLSMESLFGGQL